MRTLLICYILNICILSGLGENVDYKGYKVYNVEFLSEEQQSKLHILKNDAVDFWRKPSVTHDIVGQAMVSPSYLHIFEKKLKELGVERDIAIEDVQDFISEKDANSMSVSSRKNADIRFDYEGYFRYSEILNYINELSETYTNSTTISFEVIEAGQTAENRPLVYIKLTGKGNANIQKPIVIIEGGIIPRDWVTIPSVLYVLDQLLTGNETTLLNNIEWILIPVLNPDGYEYTHTNLRLWTKNRSTRSHMTFICPGVNLNRNFDFDWSTSDSSSTPCSHLYTGTTPNSEEETQFVDSILKDYGNRIQLHLSLQNSGGFISYPWQFEKSASGMFRQHLLLSNDMVAATDGKYPADIGSVVSGERVSGTSTDYIRSQGVLYTFTLDIIPVGDSGVLVPPDQIIGVAEDVWRAVSVAASNMNRYI